MQPRLAPLGIKGGGLNAGKGKRAQALATTVRRNVHAGEPLVGRPVNHRRFVSPAVHVAVGDALGMHERSGLRQGGNNFWIGIPNRQIAKERQSSRVAPISHDRGQNLFIGHARGFAR